MTGTYSEYLLLQKGTAPPADPHATGVRVYADETGALRFIQSDGTDAAIGGGGSPPVIERDRYTDQVVVSIASGDTAQMSWGGSSGPDALFDLTDPTAPAVLEAGVYAVAVNVDAVDPLTVDYVFPLVLDMDIEGDTAEQAVRSAPASTIVSRPRAFVSLTYYMPAGHSIHVLVTNIDPSSRDYKIEDVTVQRLS